MTPLPWLFPGLQYPVRHTLWVVTELCNRGTLGEAAGLTQHALAAAALRILCDPRHVPSSMAPTNLPSL